MLCPNCSCKESRVIDSRSFDDGASIKRRRECLECGTRFTTFERREEEPIMVLKRDGHVEPFDRSKLLKSLLSATAKRNVSLHTLEAFVDHGRKRYSQHVPRTDSLLVTGGPGSHKIGRFRQGGLYSLRLGLQGFQGHRRASRRTREPDRGCRRFGDRFRHSGVGR